VLALGGDTDTTGAVVGAICGGYNGLSDVRCPPQGKTAPGGGGFASGYASSLRCGPVSCLLQLLHDRAPGGGGGGEGGEGGRWGAAQLGALARALHAQATRGGGQVAPTARLTSFFSGKQQLDLADASALGVLVLGIDGLSRSGKSTLARGLADTCGASVVVSLDDYFRPDVISAELGGNWELPAAVDSDAALRAVCAAVLAASASIPYAAEGELPLVLVEGYRCFEDPRLYALLALKLHVAVPEEAARARRRACKWSGTSDEAAFEAKWAQVMGGQAAYEEAVGMQAMLDEGVVHSVDGEGGESELLRVESMVRGAFPLTLKRKDVSKY